MSKPQSRLSLLVAAIVCAQTGYAQSGLIQKVTYTAAAQPAAKALAELSRLTKVALAASPQTANETLVLRLTDAPLGETMDRIAKAADGSWKQEGETYRLVRTPEQLQAEERQDLKDQAEQFRRAIEARKGEDARQAAFTNAAALDLANQLQKALQSYRPGSGAEFFKSLAAIDNRAPIGRALTKILGLLDPDTLAHLEPGIKTCFSTSPTPIQLALPDKIWPVIKEYVAEQDIYNETLRQNGISQSHHGGVVSFALGGAADVDERDIQTAKVLLTIYKSQDLSNVTVSLTFVNRSALVIAKITTNLTALPNDVESRADANDRVINFSPESTEFLTAIRKPGEQKALAPNSSLRAKLESPETFDPLAMVASDCLLQTAEAKNANLVASIPDSLILAKFVPGTSIHVGTFLNALPSLDLKLDSSERWLTVSPIHPVRARFSNIDRKMLGEYLRLVAKNGNPSLDEEAAFTTRYESELIPPVLNGLAALISREFVQRYEGRNLLRFYGYLSPIQRDVAAKGMSLGSLSDPEIQCLRRMVFGNMPSLQLLNAKSATSDDLKEFYEGLLTEPTESLPNGIPSRGVLKIAALNYPSVFTVTNGENGPVPSGQGFDSIGLAWREFIAARKELFPASEQENIPLDRFYLGSRVRLDFEFALSPLVGTMPSLLDNHVAGNKTYAFKELPAEFLKKVQDQFAHYQKEFANAKPGQFGGGKVPPPVTTRLATRTR